MKCRDNILLSIELYFFKAFHCGRVGRIYNLLIEIKTSPSNLIIVPKSFEENGILDYSFQQDVGPIDVNNWKHHEMKLICNFRVFAGSTLITRSVIFFK